MSGNLFTVYKYHNFFLLLSLSLAYFGAAIIKCESFDTISPVLFIIIIRCVLACWAYLFIVVIIIACLHTETKGSAVLQNDLLIIYWLILIFRALLYGRRCSGMFFRSNMCIEHVHLKTSDFLCILFMTTKRWTSARSDRIINEINRCKLIEFFNTRFVILSTCNMKKYVFITLHIYIFWVLQHSK